MAKASATGMHAKSDRKTRGRSSITNIPPRSPTRPNVPQENLADTTRPQTPGGTKHRGDRRDMSKTYTGNAKHAARGNTLRPDVKTRKR